MPACNPAVVMIIRYGVTDKIHSHWSRISLGMSARTSAVVSIRLCGFPKAKREAESHIKGA